MIGNSIPEYVFIRTSILGLRLVAPASIVFLVIAVYNGSFFVPSILGLLAGVEASFYLFSYVPRKKRLQTLPGYHPAPMTRPEREALFHKCSIDLNKILHAESMTYPRGWFLPGGTGNRIRRQDVVTWFLWALFSSPPEAIQEEWKDELDNYVETVESLLGYRLTDEGNPSVRSMRLTLDPVKMVHRPLIWYTIVGFVDGITSLNLSYLGFKHFSSTRKWFQMFPPRPLLYFLSNNTEISPSILLPHWYHPHKSTTKIPMVFIHGIGVVTALLSKLFFANKIPQIGLHPYMPFIQDLISQDPDVGILLVELLPISMHITANPVPPAPLIASAVNNMLVNLGITRVVLVAHSYGTFVTSIILHDSCTSHSPSPSMPHPLIAKIAHVMLIDPIPILLHLPPVAYNFLHRAPSSAAEWQLWYFASTDPDIARTLGRAFFWTEGVAWKEDIRRWMRIEDPRNEVPVGGDRRRRNFAVVLAGADQIVPAESVRRYLTGDAEPCTRWVGERWADWVDSESAGEVVADSATPIASGGNLEVLFYPGLDHATVFDTPERRRPMLEALARFMEDV